MVSGIIHLPKAAALWTFVPIKGFGGAYSSKILCKIIVRINIFVEYAQRGVATKLLVNGVTFFLGNY